MAAKSGQISLSKFDRIVLPHGLDELEIVADQTAVFLECRPPLHGTLSRSQANPRGSLLEDAIEAMREVGGLGIKQVEQIGGRQVGAERRPIDQIGRRLQNIVAAGHPRESQLKHVAGVKRRQGENQRLDGEQGVGGDAVVEVGSNALAVSVALLVRRKGAA